MANLIIAGYLTLYLIPKAVLEAVYFKEKEKSKQTLLLWYAFTIPLLIAFALSFLLDHCL